MRKILFLACLFLPSLVFADKLKNLVPNSDVLLTTQASAGNSITLQDTLQSGATFYVSSGTIEGPFSVNSLPSTSFGHLRATSKLNLSNNSFDSGSSWLFDYDVNTAKPLTIKIQGASQSQYQYWKIGDGSTKIALEVGNDGGTLMTLTGGTTNLQIPHLNCSGNLNGGKLTGDSSGNISCSDDTSGGAGGGISGITVTTGSSSGFNPSGISTYTTVVIWDGNLLQEQTLSPATKYMTLNTSSVTTQGVLVAGSNITLTPSAGKTVIAASGTGGGVAATDTTTWSGGNTFLGSTTFYAPTATLNGSAMNLTNMLFSVNVGTGISIIDQGSTFIVMPTTGIFASSDQTTTSAALVNVPGFSFDINANETWSFECNFLMTGVAGGTQFGVNAPTSSTVTAVVFGDTSAVGTFSAAAIQSIGSPDSVAFNTTAAAILLRIRGTIQNSSTPGSLQIQFKSVTGGNTSTIKAGSYMTGQRLQ